MKPRWWKRYKLTSAIDVFAPEPPLPHHPHLKLPEGTIIISKGASENDDGYSAFEGRTEQGSTLLEMLREQGIRRLIVGGLATDDCVRASALDALKHGFEVIVLTDAVRGVDVQPGDSERALQEMQAAGAKLLPSEALEATRAVPEAGTAHSSLSAL